MKPAVQGAVKEDTQGAHEVSDIHVDVLAQLGHQQRVKLGCHHREKLLSSTRWNCILRSETHSGNGTPRVYFAY